MEEALVRRGTVADVPALARLRRSWTFEEGEAAGSGRDDFEEAFAAVVAGGIESGRWVVWLAEVGGEIASHAFVCVVDRIPRPTEQLPAIGYLTNVYTRPEHRGGGLGSRVLEAVTTWARGAEIELLFVWPSEDSISFYERHGFGRRGEPLVWLHPRGGN